MQPEKIVFTLDKNLSNENYVSAIIQKMKECNTNRFSIEFKDASRARSFFNHCKNQNLIEGVSILYDGDKEVTFIIEVWRL